MCSVCVCSVQHSFGRCVSVHVCVCCMYVLCVQHSFVIVVVRVAFIWKVYVCARVCLESHASHACTLHVCP